MSKSIFIFFFVTWLYYTKRDILLKNESYEQKRERSHEKEWLATVGASGISFYDTQNIIDVSEEICATDYTYKIYNNNMSHYNIKEATV